MKRFVIPTAAEWDSGPHTARILGSYIEVPPLISVPIPRISQIPVSANSFTTLYPLPPPCASPSSPSQVPNSFI
jgi:hypothetical protein